MKNELDERQVIAGNKIGTVSFYIMFFTCAVVIVAELIWKRSIEYLFGETIILLIGGIVFITGSVMNGIWGKTGMKMTIVQKLMLCVTCSGIFSILFSLLLQKKINGDGSAVKAGLLFFIVITVLSFVCLTIIDNLVQKRAEAQEKKYSEIVSNDV